VFSANLPRAYIDPDLLRRQLALQNPSLLSACHARATDWYAAHGLLGEAVEHAISIPDDERLAAILERGGMRMIAAMKSRQVSAWANRIAEPTLFRKLDRLMIALTAHHLTANEVNGQWIDRAEQLAAAEGGDGRAFANTLAWVRACALARERRYSEAAEALSSMVDRIPSEPSRRRSRLPSIEKDC
jgi:ATP/maltotriose-dependent transcriptional regulator MalT